MSKSISYFSNRKLGLSKVDQPPIPTREDLREDSPSMLQQFRNEYLAAYASVDPAGAEVTRNSHIFEAIIIAATSWICMGSILYKLTDYAFGHDLNAYSLELAMQEASWLADYIVGAERFTPPSAESTELWEMKYNRYL
jgi:hypothetical protein